MVHPTFALFGPAGAGGAEVTETHRKRLESVNFDPLIPNFGFPKPPGPPKKWYLSLDFGQFGPGTFRASILGHHPCTTPADRVCAFVHPHSTRSSLQP